MQSSKSNKESEVRQLHRTWSEVIRVLGRDKAEAMLEDFKRKQYWMEQVCHSCGFSVAYNAHQYLASDPVDCPRCGARWVA